MEVEEKGGAATPPLERAVECHRSAVTEASPRPDKGGGPVRWTGETVIPCLGWT